MGALSYAGIMRYRRASRSVDVHHADTTCQHVPDAFEGDLAVAARGQDCLQKPTLRADTTENGR